MNATKLDSSMTYCYIQTRKGHVEPPLFDFGPPGSGDTKVNLDGYAIIPREEYDELLRVAGRPDTGYRHDAPRLASRIFANELTE